MIGFVGKNLVEWTFVEIHNDDANINEAIWTVSKIEAKIPYFSLSTFVWSKNGISGEYLLPHIFETDEKVWVFRVKFGHNGKFQGFT